MDQKNGYRMLWQRRPDGGARLVRLYGRSPRICLPSQIAGHPLTEIAPYCFARETHIEGPFLETITEDAAFLRELSGAAVEEVVLSDAVEEIGRYAFYNCKALKALSIGASLRRIGSDAFMNALSFRHLMIRCEPKEQSGIRQALSQVSSDLKVSFGTEERMCAELFYPEYDEAYDEIAPAHLFGRSIQGEGFRARQCVREGRVDFASYDAVFAQACKTESEETLFHMALSRLRHPYALSNSAKEQYRDYIRAHASGVGLKLTQGRDLAALEFLCGAGLLGGAALFSCIQAAGELDWIEGAAFLLRRSAEGETAKKKRYDFDM